MNINLIVALDKNYGYSKNNQIPWLKEKFAKEDLKNFQKLTMDQTCIMGRNTYEEISNLSKRIDILPGRECVVLSKNTDYYISNETMVYDCLEQAIICADSDKDVFIIGGGKVFEEALKFKLKYVYITMIDEDYQCDKFFNFDKVEQDYWCPLYWRSKEHPHVKYYKYIKRTDNDKNEIIDGMCK